MKKKVISLLLSTILLLSMLTGCIHQDMGIRMNKDGTGSITTTVGIAKDFYDQLKSMGSDPFSGKTVTEYQQGGTTYVAYTENKQYRSYEDMEKALLAMTYETEMLEDAEAMQTDDAFTPTADEPVRDNHIFSSVNIEKNSGIFYTSYTFNAVLNPQNSEGLDYDLNETFKVTLSVEMPAKIQNAKGGAVDGNKIVFDIADITEGQELAAACEENNTGLLVGSVIVLALLVVGIVFLFKAKQK